MQLSKEMPPRKYIFNIFLTLLAIILIAGSFFYAIKIINSIDKEDCAKSKEVLYQGLQSRFFVDNSQTDATTVFVNDNKIREDWVTCSAFSLLAFVVILLKLIINRSRGYIPAVIAWGLYAFVISSFHIQFAFLRFLKSGSGGVLSWLTVLRIDLLSLNGVTSYMVYALLILCALQFLVFDVRKLIKGRKAVKPAST